MKTIKLIDLLVKLANKEESPNKIKFGLYTYQFIEENNDYLRENTGSYYLFSDYYSIGLIYRLNDTVEILEDETEKIDFDYDRTIFETEYDNATSLEKKLIDRDNFLINKMQELIDKVNELAKEKE